MNHTNITKILFIAIWIPILATSFHNNPSPISDQQSTSIQNNVKLSKIEQSSTEQSEGLTDDYEDSLTFLIEQFYEGTYYNTKNQEMFDYISSDQGTIQAIFFKNPYGQSKQEIDTFELVLFDPVYHDQKAVKIQIQLQKIINNEQWNSSNSNASVTLFWKKRIDSEYNISNLQYRIIVKNMKNKDPSLVFISLQFVGENFQFTATLQYDDSKLSTIGYCLYTTFVVSLQILSAYLLVKKIDNTNQTIVNKMSLTTMAACNIEDFYLTMVHIEYIMSSRSSTYYFYVLPSIGYVMLFVIFDMKLLFLVWRSHYMRQIDNPQALRKKLTTFYVKFYVGLFVYLTLMYFFSFDAWLIVIQNLLMLPQIIHNARTGINPGFEPTYVIGYLGARFLMPLYQRACPSNHFLLTPIFGLVIALMSICVLQILTLYAQKKIGPRFFVPKMFIPDYYNYNFKIKSTIENNDVECTICLQNFFQEALQLNTSEIQQSILKEKTIMRTPCNHYFHRDCLVNWADVKLECPTCRASLPPIIQ